MPAPVPAARPNPVGDAGATTDIQIGRAVRGLTWRNVVLASNWALGRGAQVVPWHSPYLAVASAANITLRYKCKTRYAAVRRRWAFWIRSTATAGVSTVAIEVPSGGTSQTVYVGDSKHSLRPFFVEENLSAQSSAENELTCKITATSGAIIIEGVSAVEMPRSSLDIGATEGGVSDLTVQPREPIYDGTFKSVGGFVDSVAQAYQAARRASLFQWASNDSTTAGEAIAISSITPTYTNVFPLPLPLLGRKRQRTDVVKEASARVYARMSAAGPTGTVRFTMVSGDTASITGITGTSYAWYPTTNAAAFDVDCTDMTVSDGRRSARWDDCTIDATVSAAATVYIASVSIWEND